LEKAEEKKCNKKREAEKEDVKVIVCINFVCMWTYPMLGGSLVTTAWRVVRWRGRRRRPQLYEIS
jgi:hypothetical protein